MSNNNNAFGPTEPGYRYSNKNYMKKHEAWVTRVLGEEKGQQYKNLRKQKQNFTNQYYSVYRSYSNILPPEEQEINRKIRSLIVEARRKDKGQSNDPQALEGGKRRKTRKQRKSRKTRKGTRRA